jgi:hypothetical protein
MVTVTIISDVLKTFRHIFRLPRSLASLEAKKSRIIAFFWKAVWDFEILRVPGSISELSLLNLYSSTVLQFYISFSVHFSADVSALSEGVEFGRSESQAHVGPQSLTSIPRLLSDS